MAMILLFLRVAYARLRNTPVTVETFGGRRLHLFPDGTLLPAIGGGSPEGDPEPDPEPKNNPEPDPEPDPDPDPDKLGEGGKAALDAERKAKKAAEKRARDAEARAKKLEDEKLSEEDQLKKRAEEGDQKAQVGTAKLRNANLLTNLAADDHKLVDPKAALRLITDVEYDDQDEPTNLEDRIAALKEEYPFLTAERTRRDATDPANPPRQRTDPANTGEEDDAKLNSWIGRAFGIGGNK